MVFSLVEALIVYNLPASRKIDRSGTNQAEEAAIPHFKNLVAAKRPVLALLGAFVVPLGASQ